MAIYPTRGAILTETQSAEVNLPLRLDIEAMDRPTILYMIYIHLMVSAQDEMFCARRSNIFETIPFFTRRLVCLSMPYTEPRCNT